MTSRGRHGECQVRSSARCPLSCFRPDQTGVGLVSSSMVDLPRPRGRAWEVAADAAGYEEFNPLDRVNLGGSVEMALLSRPLTELNALSPFWGSGIYAIYFTGNKSDPVYGRLSGSSSPIYVGRSVPRGARKGLIEIEEARRSRALCGRLYHHWDSINQAQNLKAEEFSCRWLVADMLFVPMAEQLVIQNYRPVWNGPIDGFGNNDPGAGRYDQQRSRWDTLHPGRYWASRLTDPPYTSAELRLQVMTWLEGYPPEQAPAVPPILDISVIEAIPENGEAIPEDDDDQQLFLASIHKLFAPA